MNQGIKENNLAFYQSRITCLLFGLNSVSFTFLSPETSASFYQLLLILCFDDRSKRIVLVHPQTGDISIFNIAFVKIDISEIKKKQVINKCMREKFNFLLTEDYLSPIFGLNLFFLSFHGTHRHLFILVLCFDDRSKRIVLVHPQTGEMSFLISLS